MCCSERKQQRGGGGRGDRTGPVALCSAAGIKGSSVCPGEFLIRADKSRAPQVINALSVSLPMFCRSGASQEESKAGGEYYELFRVCAFPCAFH